MEIAYQDMLFLIDRIACMEIGLSDHSFFFLDRIITHNKYEFLLKTVKFSES